MYFFIKGKIAEVLSKCIVLECGGIGYEIVVPNPFSYTQGSDETVYVHHYLRENEEMFYGFKTLDERTLFLRLLEVNGIGPKSALSILAGASVDEIVDAIDRADYAYLKKFPGIGIKASQQIVLDLKGKLKFSDVVNKNQSKFDDLSDALLTLGYSKKEVKACLEAQDFSLPLESILKSSIGMLSKKEIK